MATSGRESPDQPPEGDLPTVQRTRGFAAAQRMIRGELAGGVWNGAVPTADEEAQSQDDES